MNQAPTEGRRVATHDTVGEVVGKIKEETLVDGGRLTGRRRTEQSYYIVQSLRRSLITLFDACTVLRKATELD